MSVHRVSNSVRLFLCEGLEAGQPVGERLTTVTALRRGAAADGTVSDEAIGRLDACLQQYAPHLRAFVPDEVVAVGTSAVRDAPNRVAVAERIEERLDTPLRVLTGPEEAELSYVGARLAVEGDDVVLVMDIGGGSTELVRGDGSGPLAAVSMDIGSVRCTDLHLASDPPTAAERRAVQEMAHEMATPIIEAIGGAAPMIGVAGTITSLAAIDLGRYDRDLVHGHELTVDGIRAMATRLGDLTLDARRDVPGLEPARAPAIVAGALIASGVLEAAGLPGLRVSERDLLDGVALRLTDLAG